MGASHRQAGWQWANQTPRMLLDGANGRTADARTVSAMLRRLPKDLQRNRTGRRSPPHGPLLRIKNFLLCKALQYFIVNIHRLDIRTPPLDTHLVNLAGTNMTVLKLQGVIKMGVRRIR
jgi:hypothetical protein